jgi:hypothetical protein
MDLGLVVNGISLFLSILALLISGAPGRQQIGTARGANLLTILLQRFREMETIEFQEAQTYIKAAV